MRDWFDLHDPFDADEVHLKSLSWFINCDMVELVGQKIQTQLNNVSMEKATVRRKDRVRTLEDLKPATKIGDNRVYIKPTILFSRLTAIVNQHDDVFESFYYELTPKPTLLFKDGLMRKSTKANLRNYLLKSEVSFIPEEFDVVVIDGGRILHKVYWPPNSTYATVINEYV